MRAKTVCPGIAFFTNTIMSPIRETPIPPNANDSMESSISVPFLGTTATSWIVIFYSSILDT